MIDNKNTLRHGTDEKGSKNDDMEFYLSRDIDVSDIVSIMQSQKRSQGEIDSFVEKYKKSKMHLDKMITRFSEKVLTRHKHLDKPEIIEKGLKFATKQNFTQVEKEAFINYIVNDGIDRPRMQIQDLNYTAMTKFLGISKSAERPLNIEARDQSVLHEIIKKYMETRFLHTSLKNQTILYTDCGDESLNGMYLRDKHNISLSIHPVVAALFIPKIKCLEDRMIYSNIGRMVANRAVQYIKQNISRGESFMENELQADHELAYDIARDPNSLAYFSDDQPIANLLKRYIIQIKLWNNILKLRQGTYYSKGEFDTDDAITGFLRALNSYDWTHFDSPDMYHLQDEGSVLRKMMAVFSLRPSITQTSTFAHALGTTNLASATRASFITIPIINVRLSQGGTGMVNITDALSQSDYFIENKMMVPKNKSVVYSRDIAFFYVNRKYHAPNVANISSGFRYISIPSQYAGTTKLNETRLSADDVIQIGGENFELRSVVAARKTPIPGYIISGCAAVIVKKSQNFGGQAEYYYYDPEGPSIKDKTMDEANDPISLLPENSVDPNIPSYRDIVSSLGSIYVYVKA